MGTPKHPMDPPGREHVNDFQKHGRSPSILNPYPAIDWTALFSSAWNREPIGMSSDSFLEKILEHVGIETKLKDKTFIKSALVNKLKPRATNWCNEQPPHPLTGETAEQKQARLDAKKLADEAKA